MNCIFVEICIKPSTGDQKLFNVAIKYENKFISITNSPHGFKKKQQKKISEDRSRSQSDNYFC